MVPLQWKNNVPTLLAEFLMVYHLIADIPSEVSLGEFAAETLRRVEEVLNNYIPPTFEGREGEDVQVQYTTPYEQCVLLHAAEWNHLLIDAIKCPATIDKKFIDERSRLQDQDTVYSEW